MSRARDLGSLINSTAAGKNLIVNGGFDIWQRGVTQSGGGSLFIADRWNHFRDAYASGITVSRQTTSLPEFQYCARVQRDSGNTSTNGLAITQNIESINSIPYQGKTVTISFYARAGANFSSSELRISSTLYSGTATDEASRNGITGVFNVINRTSVLTTSWQRFSYTGAVPTNSNQLLFVLYSGPTGTAGANDYFEVTGIQVEAGSSATPFSRSGGDIQGELAKCQRYYYRAVSEASYGPLGTGKAYTTGTLNINVPLPVKMRSVPSVTSGDMSALSTFQFETGATAGNTPTSIALNGNVASTTVGGIDLVKSGAFTQGSFYYLMGNGNSNTYVGFSSEL
jgi:hypothetical protein